MPARWWPADVGTIAASTGRHHLATTGTTGDGRVELFQDLAGEGAPAPYHFARRP